MNKEKIFQDLIENYRRTHRTSGGLFEKACQHLICGGSHNLRLFAPFPFYDVQAKGSQITDLDGNTYIDFWQGHFSNVLGHNPPVVTEALRDGLEQGTALITGFPGTYQNELAELILNRIGAEKIRFSTSGALATMYAIMLSRAFTGRDRVMKMGGGWHGAQPFGLKGVTSYDHGLNQTESAGLPSSIGSEVITTRFNDMEDLEAQFKTHGERVSCIIMELMMGSGGLMSAHPEYVKRAIELSEQYGSLFIADEVITGFRFHAGALHTLYGIKPDLCVFGKTIGGGMPISAVAGRNDVMKLVSPDAPTEKRVKFDGGTYSAHPACMLAGSVFIKHLIEHEEDIYPRIGRLGRKVREETEKIFAAHGFNVRCTGDAEPVAEDSSLVGIHFLNEKIDRVVSPEQAWNPEISDVELREKIFKLAMLSEGFFVFHGYGSISTAHSDDEIQASLNAVERIAEKWSE